MNKANPTEELAVKGSTRRLHREHDLAWDRMQRELTECANREFPVGTHVRWIRTFKGSTPVYQTGIVKETACHFGGSWTVKAESGALHHKDPHQLERVDDQ